MYESNSNFVFLNSNIMISYCKSMVFVVDDFAGGYAAAAAVDVKGN